MPSTKPKLKAFAQSIMTRKVLTLTDFLINKDKDPLLVDQLVQCINKEGRQCLLKGVDKEEGDVEVVGVVGNGPVEL